LWEPIKQRFLKLPQNNQRRLKTPAKGAFFCSGIINAVIMKWNKKKQKAAYLKEVDQKEL
jgi:hypothetical protein